MHLGREERAPAQFEASQTSISHGLRERPARVLDMPGLVEPAGQYACLPFWRDVCSALETWPMACTQRSGSVADTKQRRLGMHP